MSGLRSVLTEYLSLRRALGFKLDRAGRLLPEFVEYLEAAGATTVTTELALAWTNQPPKDRAAWCAERLNIPLVLEVNSPFVLELNRTRGLRFPSVYPR